MQDINQINNLCLFSKNKNLEYTYCNSVMAQVVGLESPQEVLGKTDYDLVWKDQADIYSSSDRLVLQGHIQNNMLEPQIQAGGKLAHILITKNPIISPRNEIVGITGFFTDVTDRFSYVSDIHITHSGKLSLGSFFGNAVLSKREFELLKLLLNGTRLNTILDTMQIKKSTYDTFVERLKSKMKCATVGEVLHACLKSGISYLFL